MRKNIAMELLWVQQAINSRKNVRVKLTSLSFSIVLISIIFKMLTVKKVFIISYFFIVFKTKKPDVCINLWFNVSGHPYCHSSDIPEDTVFMMLSYSVVVSVCTRDSPSQSTLTLLMITSSAFSCQ